MNLPTRLAGKTSVAAIMALAFVSAQLPTAAFADGASTTQAESLYSQGKALIDQKRYHEACDKFAASFKISPTPNTRLSLAACYELDNRYASAWGEYLGVSKESPDEAKRKYAQDHASELEKKMPKLHLSMATIPPDLVLKIDHEPIPKESINGDLPLDQGDHLIEASAPGKHNWEQHATLSANSAPTALTISMDDMTAEEVKAQQNTGKQVIIEQGGQPATEWTGVKTAGFVIGGVGAAAGLGAVAFGILTLVQDSNRSTKSSACSNDAKAGTGGPTDQNCIDADNYRNSALAFQSTAIGLGIGGGALIITGIVMILVGGNKKVETPSDKPPADKATSWMLTPVVGPGAGGMGVIGSF